MTAVQNAANSPNYFISFGSNTYTQICYYKGRLSNMVISWRSPKEIFEISANGYIRALIRRPEIFFLGYVLITFLLSSYALYFHMRDFSTNTREGFEARGTELSESILAVEQLREIAARPRDIFRGITPGSYNSYNSDISRAKRHSFHDNNESSHHIISNTIEIKGLYITENPKETTTQFVVDYDDYGLARHPLGIEDVTNPCTQYYALPKFIGYDKIWQLSQAVFEVESFDSLFNLDTMKQLCEMDDIIRQVTTLTEFKAQSKLPYSFNLPYYVMCNYDHQESNCSSLTQENINSFRSQLMFCLHFPYVERCKRNENFIDQLRNYIFQKLENGAIPQGKVYVGAILKVEQAGFYGGQNYYEFYDALVTTFQKIYSSGSKLKLSGIQCGYARDMFFQKLLIPETVGGAVAVAVVAIIIWCYCLSVILTFIITLGMILSVTAAFFFYSVVFAINFFPFINLLVIVIAVAIGADDAFILIYQYRKTKKEMEDALAKALNIDLDYSMPTEPVDKITKSSYIFGLKAHVNRTKYEDISTKSMESALRHAAGAMFITSITTAVAFLTNCFSPVIVLRCFGAFASLTVTANYIFVVSALPAAILALDRYIPQSSRPLEGTSISATIDSVKNYAFFRIPYIINKCRCLINTMSVLLVVLFSYAIMFTPGIRMPEKNPLQLLRSSHPFEWFEENAPLYFNFKAHQNDRINVYVIWGVEKVSDAGTFDPTDKGTFRQDEYFKLRNLNDFETMERILDKIVQSDFVESSLHNSTTWLSGFLEWAKSRRMTEYCVLNNNTKEYATSHCLLKYIRKTNSINVFPDDITTTVKDSPIFQRKNNSTILLGYFLAAPTVYEHSTIYSELKILISKLRGIESEIHSESNISNNLKNFLIVPTDKFNFLARLYDLLDSVFCGTPISVLSSLAVCAVVIVLMTKALVLSIAAVLNIALTILGVIASISWLGWTINVLEATIIVVNIGMSFDYTLHVAVAYKSAPSVVNTEKLTYAFKSVGVPIFLAASTNIGAGLVLLTSSTQPFFEIGVFLLLLAGISYITSAITFPAMLFSLENVMRKCFV